MYIHYIPQTIQFKAIVLGDNTQKCIYEVLPSISWLLYGDIELTKYDCDFQMLQLHDGCCKAVSGCLTLSCS